MDLSVVPYMGSRELGAESSPETGGAGGGGGGRYRECLRNHAASIGGQAYDGCGEFMPGGEEGTLDALKCAACGCHRNFHRREGGGLAAAAVRPLLLYAPGAAATASWDRKKFAHPTPPPFAGFLPPSQPLPYHPLQPAPVSAAAPPACYRESAADRSRVGSETPPRREEDEGPVLRASAAEVGARKRFRTKFTPEQKEKMQAFAEKLGWRIQKHDDVALEEFCLQIGVKRHVLKVWMHNNKNHLSSSSPSSAPGAAVATPSAVTSDRDAAAATATATATATPIRV